MIVWIARASSMAMRERIRAVFVVYTLNNTSLKIMVAIVMAYAKADGRMTNADNVYRQRMQHGMRVLAAMVFRILASRQMNAAIVCCRVIRILIVMAAIVAVSVLRILPRHITWMNAHSV